MTDNERIEKLQEDIVSAINGAQLPLGVVNLVLENIRYQILELSKKTASGEEE